MSGSAAVANSGNSIFDNQATERSFYGFVCTPSISIEGSVARDIGKSSAGYKSWIERVLLDQRIAAEEFLRKRQEKLFNFLASIVGKRKIEATSMSLYLSAWNELAKVAGPGIPVPDACPGSEGEIQFNLDSDNHHFEFEVAPSGKVELFYRDRASGLIWSDEYLAGRLEGDPTLSQKIREILKPYKLF